MKSITLQLIILKYFSNIDENLVKVDENLVKNVKKNSWITSNIHKTLDLDNSL